VHTVAIIHKRSTLDYDESRQSSEDRTFADIARLIHRGSQSSVSNGKMLNVRDFCIWPSL